MIKLIAELADILSVRLRDWRGLVSGIVFRFTPINVSCQAQVLVR